MSTPSLTNVLQALDLLLEQAHTYERVLPANNYPARAAVAALSRLAEQARREARQLAQAAPGGQEAIPSPRPSPEDGRGEMRVQGDSSAAVISRFAGPHGQT